jgi:glycosyltransferase involved in cell wall biosynthesis
MNKKQPEMGSKVEIPRPLKTCLANPRVTIVTPVFNQAGTLPETIESVLKQSYENIEYIIIDDGSTDKTAEILKRYATRIQIIRQPNRGQSNALNRAWEQSTGEFLTYLSADDIMYPNCIERLLVNITNENLVYYPDFDLIDEDSRKIKVINNPEFKFSDLVCNLTCQPGVATLFSRKIFDLIGGWDASYNFIPDFEFWARASSHGGFKRVPEVLAGFRIHRQSGSIRSVSPESSDEIIRFVNDFRGFKTLECQKCAEFNSLLIAARSHLQSRRTMVGIFRYWQAIKLDPHNALAGKKLGFITNGLLRPLFYSIKLFISRIT